MKNLIYSIYALIFNFNRKIFKVKQNRICFVSMHNENFNDCLGGVYGYLKKNTDYDFVFINREDLSIKNPFKLASFFLVKSMKLASSKVVFLNDNFLPMAKLKISSEVTVCQLWHGEGAFKKFGLSIKQDDFTRKMEIGANKKLTKVVCTSKNVVSIFAEAFGVDEANVLALGSARVDYFYEKANEIKAREKLEKLYPQIKGKKVVLYAPTFRDDPEKNKTFLSNFDFDRFDSELGEQYSLLVRLHPQIPTDKAYMKNAIDVTEYGDVRELVLSCDELITDYSSITMDFALLDKKVTYFAFDLKEYVKDRDFYFDYETFVSGEVARNMDELIIAMKKPMDKEKNERFKKFNFDYFDGENARRIVEGILEI